MRRAERQMSSAAFLPSSFQTHSGSSSSSTIAPELAVALVPIKSPITCRWLHLADGTPTSSTPRLDPAQRQFCRDDSQRCGIRRRMSASTGAKSAANAAAFADTVLCSAAHLSRPFAGSRPRSDCPTSPRAPWFTWWPKAGWPSWKTKALSYVWASHEPAGSTWPSAFTANARMIAVQSGSGRVNQLVLEKRNVREDWKQAFTARTSSARCHSHP